jgi:hypothetical protein
MAIPEQIIKKDSLMNTTGLFLSLLSAVSSSIALPINISGKVTNTDGVALSGASVKLEKGNLATTTGSDGSFTITGIVGINQEINRPLPHTLSITVRNGFMNISHYNDDMVNLQVRPERLPKGIYNLNLICDGHLKKGVRFP